MWTVFFDTEEPAQDFERYEDAIRYATERVNWGYASNYVIERA